MSVRRLQLRNFRGFAEVELELKRLTVLLGPNSSGKSTSSHPLAALAHCQRLYAARRDASLTPRTAEEAQTWPIDLGGYSDLVTSGYKQKVFISLSTNSGSVEFGFGLVPTSPELLWLSHIALPQNVDVTTSTQAAQQPENQTEHPLHPEKSTSEVLSSSSVERPETRLVLERINEQQWRHGKDVALVGLDGLLPLSLLHSPGGTEIKLNRQAIMEVGSFLEHLVYLRASRRRPIRGYARIRSEQQSVGYAGEKTASVLLNRGTDKASFVWPPSTASPSQNDNVGIGWIERETTLQAAASAWLRHLQLAHEIQAMESQRYGNEFVDVRITLRANGTARDITEVGYGLSQALPVIVAALLQPKESLFIVDLPEAHLHPRPQAEMADLFCALVMCGRSALVETHSEMFFQRLRLRAAMDPDLMEHIAVYFVDAPAPDGTCIPPRRVGLHFEDEVKWPSGFLTEAIDTELMLRSVWESRGKK